MKNKFVEFICAKFPSLVIFVNYYNDYKKYAKYNFGNKKQNLLMLYKLKFSGRLILSKRVFR